VLVAGGGGNNSEELYDPGFETPLLTLNSVVLDRLKVQLSDGRMLHQE
jgi:hypothetical protein